MEKYFWVIVERYSYTNVTSIGRMVFQESKFSSIDSFSLNREYFGYTLEDTARPFNIKVKHHTCIPECECFVELYDSETFGKTIIFFTELDGVTLKLYPLVWSYILAHGGNTIEDTSGCVLVAKNLINKDKIQGSLKEELRKIIEQKMSEGYIIKAKFINLTQTS